MMYRYDKEKLQFVKNHEGVIKVIIGVVGLTILSYALGRFTKLEDYAQFEKELVVVSMNQDKFEEEKLVAMLEELDVKFPHIVLAQSIIETGHWTSKIYRENHNLFGMKEARSRVSTAQGTQYNHALYSHWRESVYDYAFYQARYMGGVRTEAEYFQALDASYARTDGSYSAALKGIIEKENLKELF